ncbi:response regulator transcription factor [Pontibacter sp. JAM-7]|uniref:response regulator transcription factor n=1 Tax=Pontibacter sp. JAM-7 TaxID=3366581 RepID=UPI003AF4E611
MQVFLFGHRVKVLARWSASLAVQNPEIIALNTLQSAVIADPAVVFVHISSISADEYQQLVAILHKTPALKLVAGDDVPDDDRGMQCLQDGFSGYTNTFVTPVIQQQIISTVSRDEIWAGPEVLQKLVQKLLHRPAVLNSYTPAPDERLKDLSEREQDVLSELSKGMSNKEIARTLDITERTVKAHLSSIFSKTGMSDRVSLVLLLSGKL